MAWRKARGASRDRRPTWLHRCPFCGTAVTDAAVASSPDDYRDGSYGPARSGAEIVLAPLRSVALHRRRRLLGRLPPAARIVDIGAGDGRFARLLERQGHFVQAIEPHREAATAGRPIAAPFEEVSLPEEPFDAAVLWHVLEHLDEPGHALTRLRSWLRPNGLVLVSVPNLASVQAQIGGDRWFHQDLPRHRVHFTADGLVRILRRTGYDVMTVTHHVPDQALLGMWQTLLNKLTRELNVGFSLTKRRGHHDRPFHPLDVAITAVAAAPLVPIAVALELTAASRFRGGSVAVVATRVG